MWEQISIFDLIQGNNRPRAEKMPSGRVCYFCVKCGAFVGLKDDDGTMAVTWDDCPKCRKEIEWE